MTEVMTEPKKKEKFKLLIGSHFEPHPTKRGIHGEPEMVQYRAGQIIESELDLCQEFNEKDRDGRELKNVPQKFSRELETPVQIVVDTVQRPDESVIEWANRMKAIAAEAVKAAEAEARASINLESMNVKELKAYADEEKIPLGTENSKDGIIKLIKAGKK